MNLKVISCNPNGGAFRYILNGVQNAFTASGATFQVIQNAAVPTDFDLYLGCSGWRQSIPEKRSGLVGIHVNPYGVKKVGSVDGGPMIDEPQEAINWTLKQKPDFVYCYCSDAFVMDYYGFYTTKHGIPVVPFPTAADITIYKPQPRDEKFNGQIGWVGGYWPYKAKMLDVYVVPLLKKYKCQVYGWGGWGNKKVINDDEVAKLFSTAEICPSVSESHTRIHPVDVPERLFKVPAGGGFTIHSPTPAMKDLFGSELPMAKDQDDWFRLIDFYLQNPEERMATAVKQRQTVLDRHTYFDRIYKMASTLSKIDGKWNRMKESIISAKSKAIKP